MTEQKLTPNRGAMTYIEFNIHTGQIKFHTSESLMTRLRDLKVKTPKSVLRFIDKGNRFTTRHADFRRRRPGDLEFLPEWDYCRHRDKILGDCNAVIELGEGLCEKHREDRFEIRWTDARKVGRPAA